MSINLGNELEVVEYAMLSEAVYDDIQGNPG